LLGWSDAIVIKTLTTWTRWEFGCLGPLRIRRETFHWGLTRPVSILYASDLHLGHGWTRSVPGQLLETVRETRPRVVLLGGDLIDAAPALPILHGCVAALARKAMVAAVPGNHDRCVSPASLRDAVTSAGGRWLPEESLDEPVGIDGRLRASAGSPVLCAHYPDEFPAAVQAGYRLVLAGHLHGGQCVLATVRDRLYPAAWFHRWHVLRLRAGAATLLVSRGVADTLPVRFNCPREVLLCAIT
jgi:predicted MPP superfamily phosphohydrolase